MIIKYVADDGKEFECEEDCLDYERKADIERFSKEICIFDFCGRKIPVSDGIEEAYYLEITTDEAAEALNRFYHNDCILWKWLDTPMADKWYYDEDDDKWCPVQGLINKVKEIEEIFSQESER